MSLYSTLTPPWMENSELAFNGNAVEFMMENRLETLGKGWQGRGNGIRGQGCWDRELNIHTISLSGLKTLAASGGNFWNGVFEKRREICSDNMSTQLPHSNLLESVWSDPIIAIYHAFCFEFFNLDTLFVLRSRKGQPRRRLSATVLTNEVYQ